LFSLLEKHPFATGYYQRFVAPTHEFVQHYIEKRQQQGVFRAGDARLAVLALTAMAVQFGTNKWLFERSAPQVKEEDVVKAVADLFLLGMRASPGQPAPPSE
jgi:hypothetical protein